MRIAHWRPFWSWPTVWGEDWDEELFGASLAVDIYETEDAVVIEGDLPGFKTEDVDITVTGDQVTIKAEKKEAEEEKKKNYLRRERRERRLARTFSLPAPVVAEKAVAEFKDGTLKLTLPKAEEAKPKQIKVKASRA